MRSPTAWPVYRLAGEGPAVSETALPLPDKPSIAVLPFTNMSGDPEQEYFSDGITEDIITELSRFSGLFVIARNSSFTYKGQAVDLRRVARELGVRYLLEGSVRRGGKRVRITAQLIDRDGAGHVWAERYDRELEDIFELQDEITRNVVGAIAPQIELAELERSRRLDGAGLNGYELALKAQALSYDAVRAADPALLEQAMAAAESALAADPRNGQALWIQALNHMFRHNCRWGPDPQASLAAFVETAERLIHIDNADAKSYMVRAWANMYEKKFDAALADHRRALALNPNLAANLFAMAWTEAIMGLADEARAHVELALRLSPKEIDIWLGGGLRRARPGQPSGRRSRRGGALGSARRPDAAGLTSDPGRGERLSRRPGRRALPCRGLEGLRARFPRGAARGRPPSLQGGRAQPDPGRRPQARE